MYHVMWHRSVFALNLDSSVGKESTGNAGDPGSIPGKIPWRRDRLPSPVFLGFPCGSAGKESTCNVGDLGLILGLGKSLGEGKGYPLQYSGLENSMDCIVHGFAKSWIQLNKFHFQGRTKDNPEHPLKPAGYQDTQPLMPFAMD